jgi:hypothetical protein
MTAILLFAHAMAAGNALAAEESNEKPIAVRLQSSDAFDPALTSLVKASNRCVDQLASKSDSLAVPLCRRALSQAQALSHQSSLSHAVLAAAYSNAALAYWKAGEPQHASRLMDNAAASAPQAEYVHRNAPLVAKR